MQLLLFSKVDSYRNLALYVHYPPDIYFSPISEYVRNG